MRRFLIAMFAVLACAAMLCATVPAVAGDSSDEKITIKKGDLPPEVLKQLEMKEKIGDVSKWVGVGKEVGQAIDGALTAITKHADEIAKTGVGKFTMVLVAWKVMGHDLVGIVVGIIMLAVFIPIWACSYWRNCMPKQVLVRKDADGAEHYETKDPDDDSGSPRKWSHFAAILILIGIVSLMFF
jgi:hypothetical protein